jgi:hypothetical protein
MLLERPRRRRKNNIKMDLRNIGLRGSDWVYVAQNTDRWLTFINTAVNIPVLFTSCVLTSDFHDPLRNFPSCSLTLNEAVFL